MVEYIKAGEILDKKYELKAKERDAIESLRIEKLKKDYTRAKWQIWPFWPVLFFGLAGGDKHHL